MPDPELESLVQQLQEAGGTDADLDDLINSYDNQQKETADRNKFVGDTYKGPDSFWGGVLDSINPFGGGEALTAAKEGAQGYAKGATLDIPSSIVGGITSLAGFGYNMATDPINTVKGIPSGLANVGRGIRDTTMNAGSDPEAFGRMSGQITGQPAVTAGIAPHVPAAIRGAGTPVAATGKIMQKYQPVSGMIPRIAEARTLRNVEKWAGRGVEATGEAMKNYKTPSTVPPPKLPAPRAVQPTNTSFTPPAPKPPLPTSRALPPSNTSFYAGATNQAPPVPTPNTATPPVVTSTGLRSSGTIDDFANQVMRDPNAPMTGDPEIDAILDKFKLGQVEPEGISDITRKTLRELGYSDNTINRMTPEEALYEMTEEMKVNDEIASGRPSTSSRIDDIVDSVPESKPYNTGLRENGEVYVVYDHAGNMRQLVGPEAENFTLGRGETYGIQKTDGTFIKLEDNGGKVTAPRQVIPRRRDYPGNQGPPIESKPIGYKSSDMRLAGGDKEFAASRAKGRAMKDWAAKNKKK